MIECFIQRKLLWVGKEAAVKDIKRTMAINPQIFFFLNTLSRIYLRDD